MADILTFLSLGFFTFSLVVWLPSCMIIGGKRGPVE
jgi:hypothetical protein